MQYKVYFYSPCQKSEQATKLRYMKYVTPKLRFKQLEIVQIGAVKE